MCRVSDFKHSARVFYRMQELHCPLLKYSTIRAALRACAGPAHIPPNKERHNATVTFWIHGLRVTNPQPCDFHLPRSSGTTHEGPTSESPTEEFPKVNNIISAVVREKDVQMHLAKQFHGSRCEVYVPIGRIDLVVDNLKLIIEIKQATSWMHGLGQIIAYSKYFPGYQRVLQLFGHMPTIDLDTIFDACKIQDVVVWTNF